MKLKVFQKGFNFSEDGTGNRLVFHLQGCNMRCPWCSNPEGLFPEGTLITDKEWLHEKSCPHGAVNGKELDRSFCADCTDRSCIKGNMQKGIRLSYKEYDVEELISECERSRPMFFNGGGVTLTGGEVSMQFEPVLALLKRLHDLSIHCAIETNGSNPRLVELIPFVDQWIMDVKHYDPEVHRSWIGVGNETTAAVLESVSARHDDLLVRIPLIPGFNDSAADADGFADFLKAHTKGTNFSVEFLPYHEYGKAKWEQCGLTYTMPDKRIKQGTVEYFEKVMHLNGICCVRT